MVKITGTAVSVFEDFIKFIVSFRKKWKRKKKIQLKQKKHRQPGSYNQYSDTAIFSM